MRLEFVIQEAVDKVCPNWGMSFGKLDDKKTWTVNFKQEATDDQKKQAQAVIDNFVWDDKAKKDAEHKSKIDQYQNDLVMKAIYQLYVRQNPELSFSDFIKYLDTL